MALALKAELSGYKKGEIRNAVSYALTSSANQARQRFEYYARVCQEFEKQFGMNSEEFMQEFESGSLGVSSQ